MPRAQTSANTQTPQGRLWHFGHFYWLSLAIWHRHKCHQCRAVVYRLHNNHRHIEQLCSKLLSGTSSSANLQLSTRPMLQSNTNINWITMVHRRTGKLMSTYLIVSSFSRCLQHCLWSVNYIAIGPVRSEIYTAPRDIGRFRAVCEPHFAASAHYRTSNVLRTPSLTVRAAPNAALTTRHLWQERNCILRST